MRHSMIPLLLALDHESTRPLAAHTGRWRVPSPCLAPAAAAAAATSTSTGSCALSGAMAAVDMGPSCSKNQIDRDEGAFVSCMFAVGGRTAHVPWRAGRPRPSLRPPNSYINASERFFFPKLHASPPLQAKQASAPLIFCMSTSCHLQADVH